MLYKMVAACKKSTNTKWEKVKVTLSFTIQKIELIMFFQSGNFYENLN